MNGNNNNLTVVANTHAIQERYYDALSWVNRGPEELTARLKLMIQNGKQLQDHEARALAQFAIATGLNPLNQECYFIPGVGPGPGVMGYRRRAMETLEREARQANCPLGVYYCTFSIPSEDEANYKAANGDIAYRCKLVDTITKELHFKNMMRYAIEMGKEMKDFKLAQEIAERLYGEAPSWEGVGVVYGSERFSFDSSKPEKWDRHERAKKRAEKVALKKRFPLMEIAEPVGWDVAFEPSRVEVSEVVQQIEAPRSEQTILSELGYDEDEPKPVGKSNPSVDFSEIEKMKDPITKFWMLVKTVGMEREEANGILRMHNNDFVAAYNDVAAIVD